MDGIDLGYRALAAAAIKVAVEDLDVAHRKVRIWYEEDKKGTLKEFVFRTIAESQKKRALLGKPPTKFSPDLNKITLAEYEMTAAPFFKPDSKMGNLLFELVDLDIAAVPRDVAEQRDFVLQNHGALAQKICAFRASETKQSKDKEI